jgi:hypothetical protein
MAENFEYGDKVAWLVLHSCGLGKRIPEIKYGSIDSFEYPWALVLDSKSNKLKWIKIKNLRHAINKNCTQQEENNGNQR